MSSVLALADIDILANSSLEYSFLWENFVTRDTIIRGKNKQINKIVPNIMQRYMNQLAIGMEGHRPSNHL